MNSVKTMMAMVAISLLTGCAVVAGKVAESDAFLSAVGADRNFNVGKDYFSKTMMPMPTKDDPGYADALQKIEALVAFGKDYCGKYNMDVGEIWSRDGRPGYEARYRQWRRDYGNDEIRDGYGNYVGSKTLVSLRRAHAGYLHAGVDCKYNSGGLKRRDDYFFELWVGMDGKNWMRAPTLRMPPMAVDVQARQPKQQGRSLD